MHKQHPVFDRIKQQNKRVEPGFWNVFTGAKFRTNFNPAYDKPLEECFEYPPVLQEEYFEWIVLLESVLEARERFVMVELGAGFGRWLLNGACALRNNKDMQCTLIGVEAEPVHFDWLSQAMNDNGFPSDEHLLVNAAVGGKRGMVYFSVKSPDYADDDAPANWYGQSIMNEPVDLNDPHFERVQYHGREIFKLPNGYWVLPVPCLPLETILAPIDRIDLIDMDIQGAELEVLQASVSVLQNKVKRIFIGTHGREIEEGLRGLFLELGWKKLWDFPSFSEGVETPYGKCDFNDGVLCYENPALCEAEDA